MDIRALNQLPSPTDPEITEGESLLDKNPVCKAFLQLSLSEVAYEKTLEGLARKVFTVEQLASLSAGQIYALLIDKKLLNKSKRFSFARRAAQETNQDSYILDWKRFPENKEFTLFNLNQLRQKIASAAEEKESSSNPQTNPAETTKKNYTPA